MGTEGSLMIDMPATDTGRYLSPPSEFAEIATIGDCREIRSKSWDLEYKIRFLVDKGKLSHKGISAWSGNFEHVLDTEDQDKGLEGQLKKERLQSAIKERISTLKRIGEEESIPTSEESGKLLIEFLNRRTIDNKPSIFLLENGNFRALWRNEKGEQIGLQFLSDGNIQFVIFARRPDSSDLARSYGIDTPEGIKCIIEANRLRTLLYS
ncbi:MAG: hypothetical protein WBO24_04715 [Nitrospirales bacterium]